MRDLSKVVTWADILIDKGRAAGLQDGQIVEALQNRLRGPAGVALADAGGGTGALCMTTEEREQVRKAGLDPDELEATAGAVGFAEWKERRDAYRKLKGIGGAA